MKLPPLFFALMAPLLAACGLGVSERGAGSGGDGGGADAGCPQLTEDITCPVGSPSPVCVEGAWKCGDPACPGAVPTVACLSCGNPVDVACVNGQWECPPEPPCPPPPSDGGTCDDLPQPACTGCYGEPVSPTCTGDAWLCPDFACPIETDGGDAGCGSLPPDECSIPAPCNGEYYSAVCAGSAWTCVIEGECTSVDAGEPFACGDLGCDPATSYCNITTGGPVDLDGGGSAGFACDLLPTGCTSGQATCACIGIIGDGCSCVQQHGDVTLTCELP